MSIRLQAKTEASSYLKSCVAKHYVCRKKRVVAKVFGTRLMHSTKPVFACDSSHFSTVFIRFLGLSAENNRGGSGCWKDLIIQSAEEVILARDVKLSILQYDMCRYLAIVALLFICYYHISHNMARDPFYIYYYFQGLVPLH